MYKDQLRLPASIIEEFLGELGFPVDAEDIVYGVSFVSQPSGPEPDVTDIIIRMGRDVRVVPVPGGYLVRDLGVNGEPYRLVRPVAASEDWL